MPRRPRQELCLRRKWEEGLGSLRNNLGLRQPSSGDPGGYQTPFLGITEPSGMGMWVVPLQEGTADEGQRMISGNPGAGGFLRWRQPPE